MILKIQRLEKLAKVAKEKNDSKIFLCMEEEPESYSNALWSVGAKFKENGRVFTIKKYRRVVRKTRHTEDFKYKQNMFEAITKAAEEFSKLGVHAKMTLPFKESRKALDKLELKEREFIRLCAKAGGALIRDRPKNPGWRRDF